MLASFVRSRLQSLRIASACDVAVVACRALRVRNGDVDDVIKGHARLWLHSIFFCEKMRCRFGWHDMNFPAHAILYFIYIALVPFLFPFAFLCLARS